MRTLRPSRRRGAARGAWLLLGLLAVGAVLLLLILRPGDAAEGSIAEVARAARAPVGSGPELRAVEDGDPVRRAAADEAEALFAGGIEIRPGVRLAGPGRLTGRVLDRASGAGVEGARVELYSMPPTGKDFLHRVYSAAKLPSSWGTRLEPIATVASGPGGAFELRGVRNGSYFLEARGGWHAPDQTVLVRVDSDGAGGPVDVFARRGGRVLGRVERADGSAVAGARVQLYHGHTSFLAAARSGEFRLYASTTDREGRFLFPGVPEGRGYDVTASHDSMVISHAQGFTVVAGEDTEVLVKARAEGAVRGQVLATVEGEEQLVPVAGAHVGVLPRGLRDLAFSKEVLDATHTVTDAEGRYLLRRVPPGDVDVVGYKQGYVPSKGAAVRAASGATVEAEPIVLGGGPEVTLRFIDDQGLPIPGVATSWFVTDFDALEFEPTFTPLMLQAIEGFEFPVSDSDGVVRAGPFPGRPPYSVFCMRAGYEFEIFEWRPSDGDEREVRLSRGGSVEGIVMDVEKAEPIQRFLVRSGRRLDWTDEEPSVINPFSGGLWIEDENGRFRLDGIADWGAPVTFVAPGYLPEEVDVQVKPGEVTRGVIVKMRPGGTVRGRVLDADGEPIAGAQVAGLDERGGFVAGHLRAPRARSRSMKAGIGQEVAMGSMEVLSSLGVLGSGFTVSEADGSYELTSLPEGTLWVHATHRDYADGKTDALAIVAGEPLDDVDLVLTEGGGLFGSVRDRFGQAVPDAIVLVVSTERMANTYPSARWVRQAGTDEAGQYRIEHMEPGGYFLACTRGDEGLNLTSFLGTLNFDLVSVPADEMVRYDITDSSAAAVRVFGTVRADGDLVRSGGLFALGFESENVLGLDMKIAQVRSDGSYEFAGLAPGSYSFGYQSDGPEVRMEVEIPDVPEYRLDLTLPTGGLAGYVRDSVTGEPIRGAEVVLTREDSAIAGGLIGAMIQREGNAARNWTNIEGTFSLPRLQAGIYQLKVGPPRWGELRGRYAPSDPVEIEVLEGVVKKDVELTLTPSLQIRGAVLTAGGAPVHRARVYALSHADRDVRPARARTADDGSFTLRSLAVGTYDLTASADGFADAPVQVVEVTAEAAPDVVLTLTEGVDVVVLVRDPAGQPLQGATGRLVSEAGSGKAAVASLDRTLEGLFSGEGVSGPDGVLRLGKHAPGTYRLEVGRGTQRATLEGVTLSAGIPLELDVELD
ncbi:MAG: carboxypeptidase regulatory-like domain-containing protein [Planctomycetota bacterium]